MTAHTLSRTLRIALLTAFCVMTAGCALITADRQMRRIGDAVYFTGIVETEKAARGPIVVVLYKLGDDPRPVFIDVVPRSRGVYHLAAPPGQYGILAFEDVNRDLLHQSNEPVALYRGAALALDAINDPPTVATGLGQIKIPFAAPAIDLPAVLEDGYAELVRRRTEEFGARATIDEPRFSPQKVRQGMFAPLQFIAEGRAGLFMLEPFDPQRVPVIFVHGIGGSPRDWEEVIDQLDPNRFQPWVFYYPSGFSINLSAMMLNNAIDELHYRYGFDTSVIVAHSMGGLVTRAALNIILREGRKPPVHHLISISTPWLGQESARGKQRWGRVPAERSAARHSKPRRLRLRVPRGSQFDTPVESHDRQAESAHERLVESSDGPLECFAPPCPGTS